MAYISAITKDDQVIVWERIDVNTRNIRYFKVPYEFYVDDDNGKYTSMYGDKVSKLKFTKYWDMRNKIKECKQLGLRTYESDIPSEIKVLSKLYYNVPAPKLNITFFDIEINYNKKIGFADVKNPYAEINSIALYHQHTDEYVVLAIPSTQEFKPGFAPQLFIDSLQKEAPLPDSKLTIIFFNSEKELLKEFLKEIENSDVLSGWNSNLFDVPYIGKRLEKYGKSWLHRLSFEQGEMPKEVMQVLMRFSQTEVVEAPTLELSGRISADYLLLYKKYEVAERPSYKLEAIADEVLPDLPKLSYEGTLADLYVNNFARFIRYNIRDTEVLKGFEDKLAYVALANEIYHLSTGTFKHVGGTIKLAELAMINYCHHQFNLIVPDMPERGYGDEENDEGIQGAFVLDPKVGMHEWIGSIDINSLYPSSIRAINISPETIVGQFTGDVQAAKAIAEGTDEVLTLVYDTHGDQTETTQSYTALEWRDILSFNKCAVSGYGTVFSQKTPGIIPTILNDWYNTRKSYQRHKKEAQTKDQAGYYDRLQYVYKIKLNSFYGALTNPYFRFYDLRMGESTTGTGRLILHHQCAKANEVLTGKYEIGDAIIYGDTDSTYFKTFAENKQEAVLIADAVAKKVNDSYQPFMQHTFLCQPQYDDIIRAGREIVSDRGIFVDKKRYILHVIDSEGTAVDKIKTMGLELKKTTLPKPISKQLTSFVEQLLKGVSWEDLCDQILDYRKKLKQTETVELLGLPKGVKKIEFYTKRFEEGVEEQNIKSKRIPGHVMASILWNRYADQYDDKVSPRIISGMKIRVFYLTKIIDGYFKSIALPVDLEFIPQWFKSEFVPIFDREAQIQRLIDAPLEHILTAIGKHVPTEQEIQLNDLFTF